MSYRIFPADQYAAMPWKNGGGVTREIFRFPEGDGAWCWRMSVAEVAADGPFSAFPGCMRSLTLLSGAGMRLDFTGRSVELLPPYGNAVFSGEEALSAYLLDGPTTDFNAIWLTNRVSVTVERRAMHGTLWCIAEPGVSWFVYFLSGHGRVKSDPNSPEIDAGDAIWLQPQAGGPRLIVEAFGEALWCRITALQRSSRV
jgi:environmental stress-induced protein Ves